MLFRGSRDAVDPYINEVCANIVCSIVGRGLLPPFLGIRLLKASPLGRGGAVRRRRGAKNIKFHHFFGQSRTPVPTGLYEYIRRTHEITHLIVGVGALDDPKTINYRNTLVERTMCAKNISV